MKRVYCLYRVSDQRQVEKNDIPMQRIACHAYAQCHGWEIIREFTEKGISGYKLHMDERDSIKQIKEAALLEKFDILLVFMFDRVGRRDDETPFVVEWLVKHGIAVWSVCEGEQRFDNHVDKLTNYIRYWQAAGESERISERTRTRLRQLTEEGHFTGGVCPYGYQLVQQGRMNRKKQPVYDLIVYPDEAKIVTFMFEKVAYEGCSVYRLAKVLNEQKHYPKSGKPWLPISLYGILRNPLYTGLLCKGGAVSHQARLQIISQELFDEAQKVRSCSKANSQFSAKGALLSGFLYCGTCGSRMVSNHVTRRYQKKDGTVTVRRIQRYYCTQRKDGQPCTCAGQHIYVGEKVDQLFLEKISERLSDMLNQSPAELVEKKHRMLVQEIDCQLNAAEGQQKTITEDIRLLHAEVLACLQGNSDFSAAQISNMLTHAEQEHETITDKIRELSNEKDELSHKLWEMEVLINKYRALWAEYATADLARKKVILKSFIRRVDISSGYCLEIDYDRKFLELFHMDNQN